MIEGILIVLIIAVGLFLTVKMIMNRNNPVDDKEKWKSK